MSYQDIVTATFRKHGKLTLADLADAIKKDGYWSHFEEGAQQAGIEDPHGAQALIQQTVYRMKKAGKVGRDAYRHYYLIGEERWSNARVANGPVSMN